MVTAAAVRKQKQRANDKLTGKYQKDQELNSKKKKAKYRAKTNNPSIEDVAYLYAAQARRRGLNVGSIQGPSPIAQDDDVIAQDNEVVNEPPIAQDDEVVDEPSIAQDDEVLNELPPIAQDGEVLNELPPIAQDETSPIVHDAIQAIDEFLLLSRRQSLLYELRGRLNQAMNGMLLDQWPISVGEEPTTRIRRKPPQQTYCQEVQNRKLCCKCTDKCATRCPCAAGMISCYSCSGPCSGNPFGSDLFVEAPWLYTFDTDQKGKGVKSKVDLYPHNLLVRYEGERCTDPGAIQKVYNREGPNYAFDLNATTVIDGLSGGIAKFINHSCDPNVRAYHWFERRLDREGKVMTKDRICFHVLKCIKGHIDELTLDYQMYDRKGSNRKCFCGSLKCKKTF